MGLVEDDEAAGALVEDADDDLVEDHLGELALDLLLVEADHAGDVVDLDAAEGLDDLDEVLLEHGVVEAAQVVADEGVGAELVAVGGEGALVLLEGAVGVGAGDGLHGLEVLAGVALGLLGGHERVDVVGEVEHDLAEQHVLQGGGGARRGLLGVVAVEGLDEVRVGRVEVLVHGVQHARLHVEVGLQQRRRVDRGGARAGARQRGARLGDVAERVVHPRLEQLHLDEHQLVVEPLEFPQQAVDEGQRVVVRLLGHVQRHQPRLEVLAKEAPSLRGRPFYT